MSLKFQVVLIPDLEEGGFTVTVPRLRGCISEGDTLDEALGNIKEAIELYLEPLDEDWDAPDGAVVQEVEL